jgi:hypothetical protein
MKSHCVYGSDDCKKCKPMNTNYVDSRTPEERERDSKLEVVITTSHPEYFDKPFIIGMNTPTCKYCNTGHGQEVSCKEYVDSMNTKEQWEEEFKWFLGSEELTNEVKDFIRETREQAKKEERERIAKLLNKALNKHSKTISDGGLDYVKAFQEAEKLEHELFFGD